MSPDIIKAEEYARFSVYERFFTQEPGVHEKICQRVFGISNFAAARCKIRGNSFNVYATGSTVIRRVKKVN